MTNTTERRVSGRYLLREQLGKGGMGTVWRATDDVLKREVAVKEVKLPTMLSSDDSDAMRDRVMREAQTAARLGHPSAVTVFDVVQEDGHTFIVMELVDAPNLADIIQRDGALPPQRVAAIGLDVLGALEAAHAQGITHRDVKPGNVMLPDGRAKLADFGIASVKGDPKLTATGMILGSPSYMAPEQASQDVAGPESDLWALGATLYCAVEGEAPFDRGQAIPTLTAVVHDEPRPMTKAGPLAPAIEALLSKDPSDRPDPARLRSMLSEVATGSAVDTSAHTAAAAAPATATLVDEATTPERGTTRQVAGTPPERVHSRPALRPQPDSDSRPWMVWLGVLVVLALLAAFLIPNLTDDSEESGGPDRDRRQGAAAGRGAEGGDEPAPEEEAEGEAEPISEGDMTTYEDDEIGYSVSYPASWDVVPIESGNDFVEPDTGRYLRVQYTTEPGPDALERIEDSIEPNFAADHPDYEQIQLTPTSYAGTDNAALWEYTYEGQHAYNLQFVTADGEYGFALNFQTPEDQWEASKGIWESIKNNFRLP